MSHTKQFYSKPYHATHRHNIFSTTHTHYLLWDFTTKKNYCPDTLLVILYTTMTFTSIHIQLYLSLQSQMQYRYTTAWCQKWFFLLLNYQKLSVLKNLQWKKLKTLTSSTLYIPCNILIVRKIIDLFKFYVKLELHLTSTKTVATIKNFSLYLQYQVSPKFYWSLIRHAHVSGELGTTSLLFVKLTHSILRTQK